MKVDYICHTIENRFHENWNEGYGVYANRACVFCHLWIEGLSTDQVRLEAAGIQNARNGISRFEGKIWNCCGTTVSSVHREVGRYGVTVWQVKVSITCSTMNSGVMSKKSLYGRASRTFTTGPACVAIQHDFDSIRFIFESRIPGWRYLFGYHHQSQLFHPDIYHQKCSIDYCMLLSQKNFLHVYWYLLKIISFSRQIFRSKYIIRFIRHIHPFIIDYEGCLHTRRSAPPPSVQPGYDLWRSCLRLR